MVLQTIDAIAAVKSTRKMTRSHNWNIMINSTVQPEVVDSDCWRWLNVVGGGRGRGQGRRGERGFLHVFKVSPEVVGGGRWRWSAVVGGGRRWTWRRTRICAWYNPRWVAVVVGGGWRLLEVVGGGRGGGRTELSLKALLT
ncbi:uncharacterized protein [Neodiprion pinetum]|uniref:uncharacterized protein isoform X1 n=1 Tax=Neodiprion pinetum TaxID=441929 RepID=UPI003720A343